MLSSLYIKDYALIEELNVNFKAGLNIITGETGAGKSIILGAFSLLLGERASVEVIRKDAQKSVVEGIFELEDNSKIKKFLDENEIEYETQLIVRREISLKGNNRCFLNDTPVPLNIIKDCGDFLVDLHGQHEHQSLLRKETHIDMLDEFSGVDELLTDFNEKRSLLQKKINDLSDIQKKESELKEKQDLHTFQLNEINQTDPQAGEEEQLTEELKILENSEQLLEYSTEIYSLIYDSDSSVTDIMGMITNKLSGLSEIDGKFSEKESQAHEVLAQLKDISDFIRSYMDGIEMDPQRIEEVRSRLGAFSMLKKKFGGTIDSVLERKEEILKELYLAENFSERIEELNKEINELRISAGNTAAAVTSKRKSAAELIKKQIENELTGLSIPDSKFEVNIKYHQSESGNYILINDQKVKFSESGADEIEFYISTNIGEDLKPLSKVASGGEISRIMLALKTILAKSDKLPLLVFDEIDVGISGAVAQKVGAALAKLAQKHQIIAITHLPQIAGMADTHFLVKKEVIDGRAVSTLKELDENGQIREVAILLSGDNVTHANWESAKDLILSKRSIIKN